MNRHRLLWAVEAACAGEDPALFFPHPEHPDDAAEAKAVCLGCPVRTDCQDHGIRHEAHGIWGGLIAAERDRIRKSLGIELATTNWETAETLADIATRTGGGHPLLPSPRATA